MNKKKTEYRRVPGSLLLAIFILVCILLTAQMMAKYMNGTAGGSSARVASFHVTSNLESFEQNIEGKLKPGDEKEYTFDFKNDSETAVIMTAKLFSEGNLPLKISYKEGDVPSSEGTSQEGWTELTDNLANKWETETGSSCLSLTDNLGVKSGAKSYTIRIEWPEDRKNYQYKQGVLALKLRIEAQQAD